MSHVDLTVGFLVVALHTSYKFTSANNDGILDFRKVQLPNPFALKLDIPTPTARRTKNGPRENTLWMLLVSHHLQTEVDGEAANRDETALKKP